MDVEMFFLFLFFFCVKSVADPGEEPGRSVPSPYFG